MNYKCPKCNTELEKIDIYNLYGSYKEIGENYEKSITELFNNFKRGDDFTISEVITCPECDSDLEIKIKYEDIEIKEVL